MANNLGSCVSKFTKRLDQVLEQGPKTSDLNINGDLLGELGDAGEIKIAKIAMDGLGDYNRDDGFPRGGVDLSWETMKLNYDRGREFTIDVIDDEEREKIVSANTMNQFARTKVVPEVDAIRFSTLCSKAGTVEAESLTTAAQGLDAVLTAEEAIEDTGVNLSECILYLTSSVKRLLRESQPWRIGQGEAPNTRFDTFDGMKIVTVPSDRFVSAIELLDGTTSGETAGGYKLATAGLALNYMIVHPSAAQAIARHEKLRYFAPDVNQKTDGHLWQYRLYHDLLVYDNRKPLIYASTVPAKTSGGSSSGTQTGQQG